ncbi:MAG: sigma-70 family RNA polymerase sigma factor [Candidatus Improbicoccus pseudotrichonymphae]|uniref:Sigma-70 family RNA polymerase sigma factor n=1 Tax=Candidatus Improbicoccus pseudotrichonymphae TaxID=3033792 RepID=A0AA48HUT9_9FIRM|nr:MAG: sigma-70 family RNA polymerase sigma factor [Candidatus Improbicoccus pseudotrichonymphae]
MKLKFNNLVSKNKTKKIKDSYITKVIFNNKSRKLIRAKKLLNKIIENELTLKQKNIFNLYYLDKMKMKEISSVLGIKQSTISVHISKSNFKIKKIFNYVKSFNSN